jgi:hypothetical protein
MPTWYLQFWEIWVPLAVGVGVGCLFIILGRSGSRRRHAASLTESGPKPSSDYDPFVMGSPSEQRKTYRRGGNPVEVLVASGHSASPEWRGWIVDRSTGGLCVCVPQEIKPGTIVRVLPVHAPEMTPWTDVEIRGCRATDDGFELGCQFVKPPPWTVMLLFG